MPLIDYAVEESSEMCRLEEDCRSSSATEIVSLSSSDNIPLLKCESATELKEFCSLTEVKVGKEDYISTITT